MLEKLALAAVVSTASAAPDDAASSVAVLPIVVEGELPDTWHHQAEDRLSAGLRRGSLSVSSIDGSTCTEWECAGVEAHAVGAKFGVWAKLTAASGGRDYALELKAVGADTENVVATLEGTCDLCGFEEAVEMVEAKAAALSTALERLGGNSVVGFSGTPSGVAVTIDGEVVGTTPLEIPLAPGTHDAQLSKAGYLPQTISVAASEGVRKELTFALVEAPKQPAAVVDDDRRPGRGMVITGGVLTGLGIAALAGGGVLLALHGRPYTKDCQADAQGDCRQLYGTLPAGSVAASLGSAALGAGVALLAVGIKRRRAARGKELGRLRATPHGLGFRF